MTQVNAEFSRLKLPYIFPIIEEKVVALQRQHPSASILNLGVGDVVLPLAPCIVEAICDAVRSMGTAEGMRGYGPAEGYPFLREAICQTEYNAWGIEPDEIFISDGANTDVAALQELFSPHAIVGLPQPTYPVYYVANVLAGRADCLVHLPCTEETDFLPAPPSRSCDLVYLCNPSNPTGVAMNKRQLITWVEYAQEHGTILLCDNAYAAFVCSPDIPKSIYAIPGAREVAIECRSFSKSAGFTGLRCGYCVVPRSLPHRFHEMWKTRQTSRSNGVAYPIQRGAEAAMSKQGQMETRAQVAHYLSQAKILIDGLRGLDQIVWGGQDAPYIWWKVPTGFTCWEFFALLLDKSHLVTIPGQGFGMEGFLRLSAFTAHATRAVQQLQYFFTHALHAAP